MTQDFSDTGSIAGRFVDVDGIRRGTLYNVQSQSSSIRTTLHLDPRDPVDKAALGKSRRLMSSCIKQQYISCHVH